MTAGKMKVTLDVATGKVTYSDEKGKTLLKEKVEGTNFIPRKDVNRDAYTVSQAFSLAPDEAIYGLGQRQSGAMNHRNQQIHLSNGNTNICIPYFTSEKAMVCIGTIRVSPTSATLPTKPHFLHKWAFAPTITSSMKTAHRTA